MWTTVKARAVDDIGNIFGEEWPAALPVGRIVFEISILNHENVAGGGADTGAQGRAAPFPLLRWWDNARIAADGDPGTGSATPDGCLSDLVPDQLPQPSRSTVGRAIVDDDNLLLNVGYCCDHPARMIGNETAPL